MTRRLVAYGRERPGRGESARMWFRRWRRRRQPPPPVLLPPLDRLAELVERVVVLLDQAPASAPAPAPTVSEPANQDPGGHVLFVPGPGGYRLLERDGPAPARTAWLDLDGSRYRVLRTGRSPLPGDRRRCSFLEEEPPEQKRTSDG